MSVWKNLSWKYFIIHATIGETFTQEKDSGRYDEFLRFQQQGDIDINVCLVKVFVDIFHGPKHDGHQ